MLLWLLLSATQCSAEGASASPLMLAPGERLSVFDAAQPGLQYEIVAPSGQPLALGGVLEALGKNGVSGMVIAARKGATKVVIDGGGRVQLKAVSPASPSVGDAVVIKSGVIVLERGKLAIFADQLPQAGRLSAVQTPVGVVAPVTGNVVPNLVSGLSISNANALTPVAGATGLSGGTALPSSASVPPNYMANVTINGVSQGLVDLRSYTLPTNANNVTITSIGPLTIPSTFAAQNVSNLSIVTPPGNLAVNTGVTLTPLSMAPVGTLSLVGSGGGLSGGVAIVPGKLPGGVAGVSGSGAIGIASPQKITPGLPVISVK
jgi:hypothetical protein